MEQTVEGPVVDANGEELTPTQQRLKPKQLTVLRALLEGKSHEEAGALVGRTGRTVQTWVQLPEFREALREGQDALFREACTLLHFKGSRAVRQLDQLMQDEKISEFTRAWSARALIEVMMKTAVPNEQSAQLAEIRQELEEIRDERRLVAAEPA